MLFLLSWQIPDSIERYQNAISNSHSKLDFALGSGLYMIPSDLVMKIGNLDNYNNNILNATDFMDIWKNNIIINYCYHQYQNLIIYL